MKNIAIVFSVLMLLSSAANAYVDNQYTTDRKFLVNVGYSQEMANATDIVKLDPYREPYVEEKNFKNIARRVYHYIVPGQEQNLDFYNHNIDSNGWGWKDY